VPKNKRKELQVTLTTINYYKNHTPYKYLSLINNISFFNPKGWFDGESLRSRRSVILNSSQV